MKLLNRLLNPPRNKLSLAPGQTVRLSDRPVEVGDIISAGDFDASQHVITAVGSPKRTWDDDFQFHRDMYPYQTRVATLADINAAAEPLSDQWPASGCAQAIAPDLAP